MLWHLDAILLSIWHLHCSSSVFNFPCLFQSCKINYVKECVWCCFNLPSLCKSPIKYFPMKGRIWTIFIYFMFLFFIFLFYFIFSFIFISWRLITSQHFSGFWFTDMNQPWSYMYYIKTSCFYIIFKDPSMGFYYICY